MSKYWVLNDNNILCWSKLPQSRLDFISLYNVIIIVYVIVGKRHWFIHLLLGFLSFIWEETTNFVLELSEWMKLSFVRSEEARTSNRNLIYKLIYLGPAIWTHLLLYQTKSCHFIPFQTFMSFLSFHLGGQIFYIQFSLRSPWVISCELI